jgi:tetratricopeptide (TPR) repeat protein
VPVERPQPDIWIDEGPVRSEAKGAVTRATAPPREPVKPSARSLPTDVVDELERAGGARRAARMTERLEAARAAFERERYQDAHRILAKLAVEAPGAASVRELHGLTLYRLERWRAAAAELETFRTLTGSPDQDPVLADCYRALHRYDKVAELWEELRAASPSAPLVAEGRIVAAGALADQGQLGAAIDVLERPGPKPRPIREHHLRQWYALADLYERSGDVPRARRLFQDIAAARAGFADVEMRLRALGRSGA